MANQYKRHLKQVQQRFVWVISRRKSAARAVGVFYLSYFPKVDFSDNFLLSKVQTEEKHFSCDQKFYGAP